MKTSRSTIAVFLCVAIIALVCLGSVTAKKAQCRRAVKNTHVEGGRTIYNKSFMWSDPKSKQITLDQCIEKCNKKNAKKLTCYAFSYKSSRFGAGCSLYGRGAEIATGSDCDMCSAYAGTCSYM
jgi:hypothetical protein